MEFPSNGLVTVEFAIDDDSGSFVFADDRLIARFKINDAEPGMTKSNPTVRADPMALPVGTTVMEALGHRRLNLAHLAWLEAQENNVVGTQTVAEAARRLASWMRK